MMAPRVRRRFVPAVLLVLVLAVVPALSAQAFPLDLTLQAQGVWWRVVDLFAQVWVRADAHRAPAGGFTTEGVGISLDGAPPNADSATEPAVPPTEAGSHIDPDG